MGPPLRIVITGAESSGKSTLTHQLGERLGLPVAMEYARIYLEQHGPDYDLSILLKMSRLHRTYQAQEISPESPLGIFDTDLINYKIWAEEVFGYCPSEILKAIKAEAHHVYLVCEPDLPWEFDPLRENPTNRSRLFQRHLEEICNLNRPFRIVSGTEEKRLDHAESAVIQLTNSCPQSDSYHSSR